MKRMFSRCFNTGAGLNNIRFLEQKKKCILLTSTSMNKFPAILRCYASQIKDPQNGDGVKVDYMNGLPVITIPLPSRKELCSFTLKPITSSVGDFIHDIKNEDQGIDRAHLYTLDGRRIASSTKIGNLLLDDFVLMINDARYDVTKADVDDDEVMLVGGESVEKIGCAKSLIAQLYTRLNVEEFQLKHEQALRVKLEHLKTEIAPLQKVRDQCERKAVNRTKASLVGGMVVMAAQYGVLARLTWWEYSWDIMEPVTYFITAGYAMAMYGYFLLTQQEYIYPAARDRVYLRFFYKAAKQENFDIERYNRLVGAIEQAEKDLVRLRDPLELHLPISPPSNIIPTTWRKDELPSSSSSTPHSK